MKRKFDAAVREVEFAVTRLIQRARAVGVSDASWETERFRQAELLEAARNYARRVNILLRTRA